MEALNAPMGDLSLLVEHLRSAGVRLRADGDQLRYEAPAGILSADLIDRMRAHKPELIEFLRSVVEKTDPTLPTIAPVPRGTPLPLSSAQRRLWFLYQLDNRGATYNVAKAVRLHGALDADILEESLGTLVARHELLRTSFHDEEQHSVQVVHATVPFALQQRDLSDIADASERLKTAQRVAAGLAAEPFDLARPLPLRAHLLRLGLSDHVFVLVLHHIVADGRSLEIIFDEIRRLYASGRKARVSPLPPQPIQYADYAAFEYDWVRRPEMDQRVAWWHARLDGAVPLQLPTDRPRPAAQSFAGSMQRVTVPGELTARLRALGREAGASLYMSVVGALATVLCTFSDQDEICIGFPVENRPFPETADLVGVFVNTVVLRLSVDRRRTFNDLLRHVRDVALDAYERQDVPFERVADGLKPERDASVPPIFQVAVSWLDGRRGFLSLPDLRTEPFDFDVQRVKFDMELEVYETDDDLHIAWFHADLFDASTVVRMAEHLVTLIASALATPDAPIDELEIMPLHERVRVVEEWSGNRGVRPVETSVPSLFADVVARSPDAVALVWSGGTLTYAELQRRASRVARALRARGVGRGALVGVSASRGPEMVAALLGILEAGAAYVPLDSTYPAERLAFMLRETAVSLVLTAGDQTLALPSGCEAVPIDAWWTNGDPAPVSASSTGDDVAYVMYTSGSTGVPKGMRIPHRGIVRLVRDPGYVTLDERDVILQAAPVSFDASTFEIWGALLNGARLVLPLAAPTLAELAALFRETSVTTVFLTTSLFDLMVDEHLEALAGLRQLLVGGDAVSAPHVSKAAAALARGHVINGYGPTENTTFTTCHTVASEQGECTVVPIGRPIANTSVYVLDRRLRPVPIGAAGELYTGGAGLALDYLARPDLTAERFVPNPFAPGRLYRTGDRVRWRDDGTLEFLGRLDHQVKVRGFRVEPAEIEAHLTQRRDVKHAVVVVRRTTVQQREIVAYVVPSDPATAAESFAARLTESLHTTLPDFMVPAAIVVLSRLPLTPIGKVDRAALPAPDRRPQADPAGGPRTDTERRLAAVLAEVLGVPGVGLRDNFFALGGNSLLAMQLVSRIRRELKATIPLRAIFEAADVEALASACEAVAESSATRQESIPRAARGTDAPLSFAQERLWFLHRLEPGNPFYNVPLAVRLRGPVDAGALQRALQQLTARHEVLRTTYPDVDGRPIQRVQQTFDPLTRIDVRDAADLERVLREEARRPFDLAAGPILRAALLTIEAGDHVLLITIHHIAADGWSMDVLVRELDALYRACCTDSPSPLPDLPIQYADYAMWEAAALEEATLGPMFDYWRETLRDAPPSLELVPDRPRPSRPTHRGGAVQVDVDPATVYALRSMCESEQTSLFSGALAAFAMLLARYTGQTDIVIGCPFANRQNRDTEGLIGFFVNTLPIRIQLGDQPTFREVVQRARRALAAAIQHQAVPFERLVDELQTDRTAGRSPIYQVVLAYQHARTAVLTMPGVQITPLTVNTGTAKFEITFIVEEVAGAGWRVAIEHDADLFEASTAEGLGRHFQALLAAAVDRPDARIGELALLSARERDQLLVNWSGIVAAGATEASVPRIFDSVAAVRPDAVALIWAEETLTYGELAGHANRIARALRARGVGRHTLVGVSAARSPELVAALLGILKAGAAYVPLDPAYPADRVAFMLRETAVPIVLTLGEPPAGLPAGTDAVPIADWWNDGDASPVEDVAAADDLAYVMYTSGSTGQPKGVCIPHRGIVRLVRSTNYVTLGAGDTILQAAPVSFDASTFEIWGALLNGARLVLAPAGLTLAALGSLIRTQQVTTLWLTAGLFHLMVDEQLEDLADVRQLLAGGDVLSAARVQRAAGVLRAGRVINGYGPTENTTFTCCHVLDEAAPDAGSIPIGRPVSNTSVYVLDARQSPVPVGVPGELYAGGAGLALGYLGQPALTAERFVPNPFGPGRLYRTGDRVRWRPDGTLEFLGRLDRQVKIRGFRVEPAEVESAMLRCADVREAVVVRRTTEGRLDLVAYVVPSIEADDRETLASRVRDELRGLLPDFMIPAAIVVVDALPVTASGKVDRAALPPPPRASAGDDLSMPQTGTEVQLAAIFAELLGVAGVGRRDSFFDLGGNSLVATQLVSRIRRDLRLDIPLRSVFEAPDLQALATACDALRAAGMYDATAALVPRRDAAVAPRLSFAQERLWFLHRLEPENPFYNVSVALALTGELDEPALARALRCVVERHDVLRTTYPEVEGRPLQSISADLVLPLVRIDLTSHPAPHREVERLANEKARRPFDLATGPVIRATLLVLGPSEHVLLLTVHHIAADGWSLGVFVREITAAYTDQELPDLPIQYADFASWQRQRLQDGAYAGQADYWVRQLAGFPSELALATDRPRPPAQSFRGHSVTFAIDGAACAGLKRLCREQDATLFMALLAAFATVLGRHSGQEDLIIGSPIANRTRAEVEPLIGFFVNTLALRLDLSGAPSFRELLSRVRTCALDAYANQDLPFERLVDLLQPARDLSRNPLFQVMFALQNAPVGAADLPGLHVAPLNYERTTAQFDLVLDMWEGTDRLLGVLEFSADLFDRPTVERLVGHLQTILAAVVRTPDARIFDLPLLSEAERHTLLHEFNGPRAAFPVDRTLSELFEEQVAAHPDRTAAEHCSGRLSYRDLNDQANRLAHRLRRLGARPNNFVAVVLDRGLDLVVSVIAVLKSGAAFVPIDATYPGGRIAYMVENSAASVVLTSRALIGSVIEHAPPSPRRRDVIFEEEDCSSEPVSNPDPVNVPGDRAYMLYTSGSTGVPKGALIRHDGKVNHIYAQFQALAFHRDSAFLQTAPASSDISVWQILAPLLIGGRTVIADHETVCDPAALWELIQASQVTLIELVPVALTALLDHAARLPAAERTLRNLEWAMATGETVPPSVVNRWLELFPSIPIVNAYGPTEAADDVCEYVVRMPLPPGSRSVPVGTPLPNLSLYVLDARLNLVPIGVPGEICVSGIGVGEGYWHDDRQTHERFVTNPYRSASHGDVLYRTGDSGVWRADGILECLSRLDEQVKIRGFRIELGEVEAALASHPAVAQAVLVARRDDADDEQRLTAYVVPSLGIPEVESEIRRLRSAQVGLWRDLHEDEYRRTLDYGDPTFNVIGWDSSYTSEPLPIDELYEYVDHTTQRILALRPRRLLEIGCGSGLLMFRLVPHLESYTGLDFSQTAIDRLRELQDSEQIRARVPGLSGATFRQGAADDLSAIEPGSIDTVVLSSVLQYFPGAEYLLRVMDNLVPLLAPDAAIFIGDVRSLPLLELFHASVALAKADPGWALDELCARVSTLSAQEQEFAVDPGYFYALQRRHAAIRDIRVQPKGGRLHNEMTRFRYDVTLRCGARIATQAVDWRPWEAESLDLDRLRRELSANPAAVLALEGVPNGRLRAQIALRAVLGSPRRGLRVAEIRDGIAGAEFRGFDPEELRSLGSACGFDVHMSLARGGPDGRIDVAFVPAGMNPPLFPAPDATLPWAAYANNPLLERLARAFEPRIREHLKARLPHYMVPSSLVMLDRVPTTPAGKIDRRALPPPRRTISASEPVVAPRDDLETVVAQVWREVLGLDECGITQNFFSVGGHSLKATQVVSRIKLRLGIDLPLRTVFTHPTIEEFANLIKAGTAASGGPSAAIGRIPDAEYYPLSHAQRRLWVLSQFDEASIAYNMPVSLLIEGPLDRDALERALSTVVDRHESLRTTFVAVDGEPRQRVQPAEGMPLPFVDLSGFADREDRARLLAVAESATPFDLEKGPLVRASLLRLAPERHVLLFNTHHIVGDDWSHGVIVREAIRAYGGATLPVLRLQYRDYENWHRTYLDGPSVDPDRAWWQERFSGELPTLDLPGDFPRPPLKTYRGGDVSFRLGEQTTRALRDLSAARGASLFMTLVAAVKILLHRYTGQRDIIVVTPVAGRDHPDLEGQIGCYVNTLPLRDHVNPEARFEDFLSEVTGNASAMLDHQRYPFDRLVDDLALRRDPSRMPVSDVVVVMQNAGAPDFTLPGLAISEFDYPRDLSKYDVHFWFEERGQELHCALVYNPDLFERDRIERMRGHLTTLLVSIIANPERRIQDLDMLGPDERQQLLVAFNPPAVPDASGTTLVEWFTATAARTPTHTALSITGEEARSLSYAELDSASNRMAHALVALGVGPDVLVGLAADRSIETIVGLLGIIKAGGAYVPVDPEYPSERISYIVQDARLNVIVGGRTALQGIMPVAATPVVVDDVMADGADPGRPIVVIRPDHLAYVIYTSGSTGQPKGVMVTHRNVTRLFEATREQFHFTAADVWTLFHSIAFDFSVWEIWGALLHGGRLVILPHWTTRSPRDLIGLIRTERVTVLNQTPSAFRVFDEADAAASAEALGSLRFVVFGGEALDVGSLGSWFDRHGDETPRLINMYGITETTVHTTHRRIRRSDVAARRSVIGRPLADLRIHVLDDVGEPAPIGVAQEIWVGGDGAARGYLNQPALTAERFVPDPFVAGKRMYRSGDAARYLDTGDLEYLGRIDQQVKIRGHRIEPGEIQAAIEVHPAVRQALVTVRMRRGANSLVAYVAANGNASPAALRDFLRVKLPEYMVPEAVVFLDAFPLTTHGKIDRRALPDPDFSRTNTSEPASDLERLLSSILEDALQVEHVNLDDNFFELGAHSLVLIRAHAALQKRCVEKISLVSFYQFPTIRLLAAHLAGHSRVDLADSDGKARARARRQARRHSSSTPEERP
jgi:amino acid adenylation domain-containing protein